MTSLSSKMEQFCLTHQWKDDIKYTIFFPLLSSYIYQSSSVLVFIVNILWVHGWGNLVQYWSVVFITDMDWSEIKIVPVWVLKFPQHWSHSAWSTADKWLGEAINHPNIEDQGSRALTFSPSKHHWALICI